VTAQEYFNSDSRSAGLEGGCQGRDTGGNLEPSLLFLPYCNEMRVFAYVPRLYFEALEGLEM